VFGLRDDYRDRTAGSYERERGYEKPEPRQLSGTSLHITATS
jgi:hypothetical protein